MNPAQNLDHRVCAVGILFLTDCLGYFLLLGVILILFSFSFEDLTQLSGDLVVPRSLLAPTSFVLDVGQVAQLLKQLGR